jgi:CheY-like chemotaxis protein
LDLDFIKRIDAVRPKANRRRLSAEWGVRRSLCEAAGDDAGGGTGNPTALRVLVVDDDPMIAQSFDKLLQVLGYRARTAHDGDEALRVAAAFGPDAAVIDISLPGMSGHEIARSMRKEPWGKNILLIAASGWDQEEDRERSREAGFDHHLAKPVDIKTLRRLLEERARGGQGR